MRGFKLFLELSQPITQNSECAKQCPRRSFATGHMPLSRTRSQHWPESRPDPNVLTDGICFSPRNRGVRSIHPAGRTQPYSIRQWDRSSWQRQSRTWVTVNILKQLASIFVDSDPRFEIMPGTKARDVKVAKAKDYEAVPRQTIAE